MTSFVDIDSGDPSDLDLLNVAGEDGFLYEFGGQGLAGRGEALRLDIDGPLAPSLREVSARLRAFSSGAVAFVAIPFTSTRPIVAVVPEITVRRSSTKVQALVHPGVELPEWFLPGQSMRTPTSFSVSATRAPKEWCDAVGEATRRIGAGALHKVALAREVIIEADAPFSQVATLTSLRRTYPSAYLYAIDGIIGASPELLIERDGSSIRSMPLAGTLPRSSDPETDVRIRDSLLLSEKDRAEHEYLAQTIRNTLSPLCSDLRAPAAPEVMSLANVHHLVTPVTGRLADPNVDVLDLVAALHPTPAVGGTPTAEAMSCIQELEDLDRGYYAGAVGWVDAQGNGSFAIAIRGAQIEGARARVIAGNGIVAASDPKRELEETRWKLQVMLTALIRP